MTRSLLLANDDRPNSTPNVSIELVQRRQLVLGAQPEVPQPTSQVAVETFEARRERLTPVPRRKLANPDVHPLLRAARDRRRDASTFACAQAEAEEGQVRWSRDGTLIVVHQQTKSSFDKPTKSIHHPTSRALAVDEHTEVVGITHEPQPPMLKLPIQFVENDIGQQGREHASNDVAKLGLTFHIVIPRSRLKPTYGEGSRFKQDHSDKEVT